MHIGTHHNNARATSKAASTEAKKAPKKSGQEKKAEAKTETPKESVTISYLPQDPDMIPAQKGEVEGQLEPGPTGPRLKVSVPRNFPTATPDAHGHFHFDVDDPNFDSANTYFVAHQTLNIAEKYAERDIPWSFTEELGREQMIIHPHAGSGVVNAFYTSEGGSINFFNYQNDQRHVHRTGMMSDVIAHETGHAILDALRPTYIRTLDVPAGGFHESFGDMIAMLRALHEPSIIEVLKSETKGDLGQSNIVTRLAEQLGADAYGPPRNGGPAFLRDAVNDHKFADQHFLPYTDPSMGGNGFGTEPHAYATLFTGAFYDLFGKIYDTMAADPDKSFTEAVAGARDLTGSLLMRAIEIGPIGNPSYPEMAEAFIQADAIDNDGALRPLIEETFRDRGILSDKNVSNIEAKLAATPEVKLTASATEEKGANKFLAANREALGLPKDVEFTFEKAYSNKKGETFLTFSTSRQGLLDDPDFGTNEGSKYEGIGGLVLGFDKSKKLFVANYDEVTDREMSDIKDNIRSLSLAGNLVHGKGSAHDNREKVHVELVNTGKGTVLRKSPVLYC